MGLPNLTAMTVSERAGLTPSQRDWLRVHAYMNANRHELAVRAAAEYPPGARVAGTPLLAAPAWRPAAPVPLADIRLEFRPPPDAAGTPAASDAPAAIPGTPSTPDTPVASSIPVATPGVPDTPEPPDVADVAPDLLPVRPDGTRYQRHSDVLGDLAAPAIFENRVLYRLIDADLAGAEPRLTFTRGRFFDGVNVGGAAAHEYAAAMLSGRGEHRLRAAIGDPCGLRARSAAMAISTLTLRHDRAAGTASFPLHYRDPARVAHAGGLVQVMPVGIFQPSGEAAWNEANDFGLWRGMLREFAEELLGHDEDHGSEAAPIDYDRWPFASRMTAEREAGRIRLYCLGLGVDPLTFAVDLLTVAVIDAAAYDALFGALVSANSEGTVLPLRPFDAPTITELTTGHPVQAAGAALLELAIAHRDVLLGGHGAYQPRSRHS